LHYFLHSEISRGTGKGKSGQKWDKMAKSAARNISYFPARGPSGPFLYLLYLLMDLRDCHMLIADLPVEVGERGGDSEGSIFG
jgi:hypothetical protein